MKAYWTGFFHGCLTGAILMSLMACAKPKDGAPGSAGLAGHDGHDGFTSILKTTRTAIDTTICASGTGTLIQAGLDLDANRQLDPSEVTSASYACDGTNGRDGTNGSDGKDGKDGHDGLAGRNGVDGRDGVNGHDGRDGLNGAPAPVSDFAFVSMIDPCGDTPGIFDEVLFRLQNGTILGLIADNANGDNPRLGLVPAGNWVTSDGSRCYFSVSANGAVTW